jgi:hypothetical protein
MDGSNLKSSEIVPPQFANRGKTLGSCSEVDRFRVLFQQGLLIESAATNKAFDFLLGNKGKATSQRACSLE